MWILGYYTIFGFINTKYTLITLVYPISDGLWQKIQNRFSSPTPISYLQIKIFMIWFVIIV